MGATSGHSDSPIPMFHFFLDEASVKQISRNVALRCHFIPSIKRPIGVAYFLYREGYVFILFFCLLAGLCEKYSPDFHMVW